MTSEFYVCIHGHFYQPPRENAWLEKIDHQESAKPYHDWNERISAECYRTNGLSQRLDHENWVVNLSNNYSRMSFNFGPTLLSWLEDHDPQTYQSILDGDRESLEHYNGHGSAIAQVYNHIIMPLANRRDKETQIVWGLRDFEKRFGRKPEGMWLAETAVDTETLELLAAYGMKYVILAPRQAQAVRPLSGDHVWQSVRGEKVDTHYPYEIKLKDGKSIAAFFYDGVTSRAVAFEGLLNNGEVFAERLYNGFDVSSRPQLLHIATDGESYGHHHLRGDMALSYVLQRIEQQKKATLINYGQFLELFPPQEEAQIFEDSSWSCIHGIERWRSDCGCNSGMRQGWHQKWRKPLREAMDFLRDSLAPAYEDLMAAYTDKPWEMRNAYIEIILDRTEENREKFFDEWAPGAKDLEARQKMLSALEMQRQLLLMYTSCAWFFDEISGVETVQALQYAARAVELSDMLFDFEVEPDFLRILETAPSNIVDFGNGRRIYEMFVRPARVDLLKIATNLAARALFEEVETTGNFACFDYRWHSLQRLYSGRAQLIVGHIEVSSRITGEHRNKEVVALHLGDHNLNVGALPYSNPDAFRQMAEDFTEVFAEGNIAKSLRLLDKYFEGNIYYLNDMLYDQQREIVQEVFSQTLDGLEEQFTSIYQQYYPVMTYFSNSHMALPQVFSHIAHFVQNKNIKNQLRSDDVNFVEIQRYVSEAKSWKIDLDEASIENNYLKALSAALHRLQDDKGNLDLLKDFARLVELKNTFPFKINLEPVQNAFALWVFENGDKPHSEEWVVLINSLASTMKVRLDAGKTHD